MTEDRVQMTEDRVQMSRLSSLSQGAAVKALRRLSRRRTRSSSYELSSASLRNWNDGTMG